MEEVAETANLASFVTLLTAGLCLLEASPLLLIFATVDVSPDPSTTGDVINLVGLPWLAYASCGVIAVALMRCRWNLTALAIAAVPAAAETSIYVFLRYR